MFVVMRNKWAGRLLSCFLIALTAFAALRLLPGMSAGGLIRASVVNTQPVQLDRTVYRFDGTRFMRIGQVLASDGSRHRLQVALEEEADIGGQVAVEIPVTLKQYVRMLPERDLQHLRDQIVGELAMASRRALTFLNDDPRGKGLRDTFAAASRQMWETPDLQSARDLIVARMQEEVSPLVFGRLRAILISRITKATELVYADATEDYGLDLVTGRFDLAPMTQAVDGVLADPRLLDAATEAVSKLTDDPEVTHAAQAMAVRYAEILQDRLLASDALYDEVDPLELKLALQNFLTEIEGYLYRDGSANPVIVAMARNMMSDDTGWSDTILVLMTPDTADRSFSDFQTHQVSFGWDNT